MNRKNNRSSRSNFILPVILIVMACSGCSSVNVVQDDVYNALNDFGERQVPMLVDYIDQDETLSTRDKNTLKVRIDYFLEKLNKITPENN